MTDLAERIRERGHWIVAIRPEQFQQQRIERIEQLYPLVQSSAVEIRGWDFPHIDQSGQHRVDVDWVGQESEWQQYLESWRIYTSGQFLDLSSFPGDWRDRSTVWPADAQWEPGTEFGVGEAVFKFVEILEFAARLAMSEAGDQRMEVSITASGLAGRKLIVDDPRKMSFAREYRSDLDEFTLREIYDREHLVAETQEIALTLARELMVRFHWNVNTELLAGFLRPW